MPPDGKCTNSSRRTVRANVAFPFAFPYCGYTAVMSGATVAEKVTKQYRQHAGSEILREREKEREGGRAEETRAVTLSV